MAWLSRKKWRNTPPLGLPTTQFVGHEIDKEGINMSTERIKSAVDIEKPTSLRELYQFVGVANYFRDHIANHSTLAKSLNQMIT
jgi:hypothetical protein